MTKNYYNKNAKEFIENTINLDMNDQYSLFEKYLPKGGKILDLGFGSGRDSKYFHDKGYKVISTDISEEFVKHGKEFLNNEVILLDTLKMNFLNEFDGIWACSSLLHFNDKELELAFKNCYNALKENGVLYTSFKKGSFKGERNGRFFHDLEEEDVENLIKSTPFKLIEILISEDVRPDRIEKWINLFLKK